MDFASRWPDLERVHTSYLLLGMLAGAMLAAGLLFQIGLIGWVLRGFGYVARATVRGGFRTWEHLFGWATWEQFLGIAVGLLLAGGLFGGWLPVLRIACGVALLIMGSSACFTYMFIDLERNEVERGYKSIHNPLKGQLPADNLKRYGRQVGIPLLISAAVAAIGGFALLNQGLYETVGRSWYRVAEAPRQPIYADFLAFAITRVLGLMDVLDLAKSHHILGAESVRPAAWPASTLASAFKVFFTVVLLHQVFASLRQGKMLAETIADFWSPHEPIHERARYALPVYGIVAIGPLLRSLRSIPSLTKEQRDQLPLILETMGPTIIPALVRHLNDPHEHVRAVSAAALGRLHASDSMPALVDLFQDPSPIVRQGVTEALGRLGERPSGEAKKKAGLFRRRTGGAGIGAGRWIRWIRRGAVNAAAQPVDPVELAVTTLDAALEDESTAVRTEAVEALGRMGPAAAAVAPKLIALSKEGDESLRCQVARSLGEVGGDPDATVAALVDLLDDASPEVKAASARALGAFKEQAASAVPSLATLLQDRDEAVRTAAAEAIAQVGPLDEAATETLVEGLTSEDTVVRAQTAQALGTIGAAAEEAAPALVEAMEDDNDRVRAEAVEAIGKIGEAAAEAAVPGLVKALEDEDDTVGALAAEALGQMGESAAEAVPALVASLQHLNPQVRHNAAEALGNLGPAEASVRLALEGAVRDEDGGVRSQAVLALGKVAGPADGSMPTVLAALQDEDPLVRTAAVTAAGLWGDAAGELVPGVAALLDDPNDQVKVEVARVLPRLAGAAPDVIEGLCRRLLEDDSPLVQSHAALALGKLGPDAAAAGEALLRAAQTGEVGVREQAMRAIVMIRPAEAAEALIAGLKDASTEVRILASAGWVNVEAVPADAVPGLIEALRDPEIRVRANAANALARLESVPIEAVSLLIDCASEPNDALRLAAATALRSAPAEAVAEVMEHLTADPNARVRLAAASSLLAEEADHAQAGAVLVDALAHPSPRVREEALEVFESLGDEGAQVLDAVQKGEAVEEKLEEPASP
ncbi:HEAT repeat domain-containing protein [Paludisphaera mucosa]|uniref:HEAT repeat domain-containing protein n=1 Tax=Paludisphaera mucosa TaxID=3030827 RepID=A0ABT6F3Y0_9BACT|nr:HEAT repeat domain-containing protein [Paludisphaera mucosa]MDG3002270.1 HEAT repeat domain-containing protein [Paludisphaera mucosa]